jgi:hypothetical protein
MVRQSPFVQPLRLATYSLVQASFQLSLTPMKKILASFTLVVCAFSALAAEPTDASVDKLLTLTKAESMMDSIYGNLEQNMRQGMKQATAGKKLTDEQTRLLESAQKKHLEVMHKELTWSDLKPVYTQIYKENFDQADIDGLTAFYSSKVGQNYLNKMPVAMQKSVTAVQQRMAPVVSKMGDAMKAALAEAKVGK